VGSVKGLLGSLSIEWRAGCSAPPPRRHAAHRPGLALPNPTRPHPALPPPQAITALPGHEDAISEVYLMEEQVGVDGVWTGVERCGTVGGGAWASSAGGAGVGRVNGWGW
jgi:hypothetical protein